MPHVRVRLTPSLMPAATDQLRWMALQAIGYDGPGRTGSITAMASFDLSAQDYETLRSPNAKEPPSVAMLRFMAWLLVAPRARLTALVTTGSPVESMAERANIGLALCTMCDQALETSKDDDGVTAAALRAWRELFRKRFGIAEPGEASEACWQNLLLRALRVDPAEMLPTEPDAASVASRVLARLSHDDNLLSFAALTTARASAGAGGAEARACDRGGARVHVEDGWLPSASAERMRSACEAVLAQHCPSREQSGSAPRVLDLLAPSVWPTLPPVLLELARLLERLRLELTSAAASSYSLQDVALLELREYRPGGDGVNDKSPTAGHDSDAAGSDGRGLFRRAVSLRVFLMPPDWDDVADGGRLLLSEGEGRAAAAEQRCAVTPRTGRLITFDSESVPSCTVEPPQRRAMLCVSGYFCEGQIARYHRSGAVNLASTLFWGGAAAVAPH